MDNRKERVNIRMKLKRKKIQKATARQQLEHWKRTRRDKGEQEEKEMR